MARGGVPLGPIETLGEVSLNVTVHLGCDRKIQECAEVKVVAMARGRA
jgi:hypothetical protein